MKTIQEIIEHNLNVKPFLMSTETAGIKTEINELTLNFLAIAKEICEEIERMANFAPRLDEGYDLHIPRDDWRAFKKANGME